LGRIRNHLRDYFKELFKTLTAEAELNLNPEFLSFSSSKPDPDEIESFLKNLVQSGVISETDKYILLASLVYKHSLKEIAKKVNLSYENVRQRRSRVVRKMKQKK
jgi:DNA-directed RNA polymerase sigma subunit (sigma70/sigma32)